MGFLDRLERRSLTQDNIGWNRLIATLSGGPTAAGVVVNEETALRLTAVLACQRVIAQPVATVPLNLYRRTGEDSRERASDDYRDRLVSVEPDTGMQPAVWRETLMHHALGWGNGYARKIRKRGRIERMEILRPDRTRRDTVAGKEVYVTDRKGGQLTLAVDEVMHLPGMGFDGRTGYSPIHLAREAIAAGLAAEAYAGDFFSRGARADLVLEHPGSLSDKTYERLLGSINARLRSGTRETLILEEGMKSQNVTINPNDAMAIESQRWTVQQVARAYGVPLHRIQETSNTQPRANLEEDNRIFIESVVLGWVTRFEQTLGLALLDPDELQELYFRFNLSGLLRGDTAARWASYQTGRQWGVYTSDEIRALEDRNPIGGEIGESVLIPLNMVPIRVGADLPPVADQARSWVDGVLSRLQPAGEQRTQPIPEHRQIEAGSRQRSQRSAEVRRRLQVAYATIYAEAAARWVRVEVKALGRLIAKAFEQHQPDPLTWLSAEIARFYGDFGEVITREILPVLLSHGAAVLGELRDEGYDVLTDAEFEAASATRAGEFASAHIGISQSQLGKLAGETPGADLRPVLEQRLDDWSQGRPGKIASGESVRWGSAVARLAFAAAGVSVLRWVTFGKSCPICSMLAGRVAVISGSFAKPGDVIDPQIEGVAPLAITKVLLHAPAHDGCDCGLAPG